MARVRAGDLARAHDDRAIAAARDFAVNWFVGRSDAGGAAISRRDLWRRADFRAADYARCPDPVMGARELALAAARLERDLVGPDSHGRMGMLYAICPNGLSLFLDGNPYRGGKR